MWKWSDKTAAITASRLVSLAAGRLAVTSCFLFGLPLELLLIDKSSCFMISSQLKGSWLVMEYSAVLRVIENVSISSFQDFSVEQTMTNLLPCKFVFWEYSIWTSGTDDSYFKSGEEVGCFTPAAYTEKSRIRARTKDPLHAASDWLFLP